MSKPYTIAIYSLWTPDTPEGIGSSFQMLGWGLRQEFAKLPHVELQYVAHDNAPSEIHAADFTMIHDLFAQPIYGQIPEIKEATRKKVIGFMEIPFPSPLLDKCYTFLPTPWPDRSVLPPVWPEIEQIHLPCVRELLEPSAHFAKTPGSVLLDHGWVENGTQTDWLPQLYEWLAGRPQNRIAQLRRERCEKAEPPAWVKSIPEIGYPTYLTLTANYETFIVTHPGSYEHSIIDMAARGIRVLVPKPNGRPFCNQSIIDDLHLSTFTSRDELLALLDNLPEPPPADRFTDMPEIVAQIDAYCQESIGETWLCNCSVPHH